MRFFPALARAGQTVTLRGNAVHLRHPVMDDYDPWFRLRMDSRDFLVPWEAEWHADDHARASFRARLRHYRRLHQAGQLHPFFIFRNSDGALLGSIMFNNVRRGIAETATLGYWIGKPHAGQGYMTDALNAAADWAFTAEGLHRLEAACLPANTASRRLLARCGFLEEGYAQAYLRIAGKWADHVLYARLNPRHQ